MKHIAGLLLLSLLLTAGCLPDPLPPGPTPDPEPSPAPVIDAALVVVIEESDSRQHDPARAAVLSDLQFWQSLEQRGIDWRILDDDDQSAIDAGYVAAAGEIRPALLVLVPDGDGVRVAKAVRLPDTTAGVQAAIGK